MFLTQTHRISTVIDKGAKSELATKEITKNEISEWNASTKRQWMLIGQRYYENNNDIRDKDRSYLNDYGKPLTDPNLSNARLANPFLYKLVNQKVSYLLSNPFVHYCDNPKYAKAVETIITSEFHNIIKSTCKEMINKGIAWLHLYFDQGNIKFKLIPSEQIIPLWSDSEHTKLDAIIRCYTAIEYYGSEKKSIKKVQFWDKTGVQYFIFNSDNQLIQDPYIKNSAHFSINRNGETQHLNWIVPPFIPFKYNSDEIPLVKFIKNLVDDYDAQKSRNADNLFDLPNSILVVENFDGTDLGEFRRDLAKYRAVAVSTGGSITSLHTPMDTQAFKNHISLSRKDIFEFGRGVDSHSDKFSASPSGVALKFLYADLDSDCSSIQSEIVASLDLAKAYIDQFFSLAGIGNFFDDNIQFVFNKSLIINEAEIIESCKKSASFISYETAIANHPWVSDVNLEKNRLSNRK